MRALVVSFLALVVSVASAQPGSGLLVSPTAHATEGFSFGSRGYAPAAALGVGPVSLRAGVWTRPGERTAIAIPSVEVMRRGRLVLGVAGVGVLPLERDRWYESRGTGVVLGLATYGTERASVTVGLGGGVEVVPSRTRDGDRADPLGVLRSATERPDP